ncbi:MMPL family transporter [Helcobacillus massiliensis]|uniref:RND superfamily putative drug exporter n=2 Tax=Helcobacillus massiliensis TaxID=521392 RepID=A0A839QVG3_9MICO|nr:MMPL family transporter [Helcobacillus massiliensis]MBB3024092.1 RND superfamily putative drug exporter [Helcobacillus massiliensis]
MSTALPRTEARRHPSASTSTRETAALSAHTRNGHRAHPGGPGPAGEPTRLERMGRFLTSTKGAWITLALAVVVALAIFGGLRGTGPVGGMDAAPATAESTQAKELLAKAPGSENQQVMAVVSRPDGAALTPADMQRAEKVKSSLAAESGTDAFGPIPSEDGKAVIVGTQINTEPSTSADEATATSENNTAVDAEVKALRETAHRAGGDDLTVQVTGGPAIGSDIRGAFVGADFTLLAVTIAVVAVLLLLTYRSPILWIVPLVVIALADGASSSLTSFLGEKLSLAFDAGVISVLVFGTGANYALLLISRYREELHVQQDQRSALATAWSRIIPAIVTSNVTVVLSLLTLMVALMPATRGLGIAAAAGLLLALLAVVFPLTALLALLGRGIFWPFIPRPAHHHEAQGGAEEEPRGLFAAVARAVTARPVISGLAALAILVAGGLGLVGTQIGLSQSEQFATASESRSGLETMAAHYPAGEAGPHTVVAPASAADGFLAKAKQVEGVQRAHVSGKPFTADGGTWVPISVTGTAEPETAAATAEVDALRSAATDTDPRILVGGTSAAAADVHDASVRDLTLIAPLIVLVVLVLLGVLLRSVVAPIVLMALTGVSTVGAIGIGTLLGEALFDWPGLDITVPLIAFLFLVALGVDYSIFLAHRIRQENRAHPMRSALVRAVSHTGVVITSAGVVLAAVFAALGVLPLVVLGQLGLIVGLGVLIDTVLVRTVLVPAVFTLIGDRVWWPTAAVQPGSTP